jgi:hypothetical protein
MYKKELLRLAKEAKRKDHKENEKESKVSYLVLKSTHSFNSADKKSYREMSILNSNSSTDPSPAKGFHLSKRDKLS